MTAGKLDVLLVAPEPCWPAINGGRARTNGLARVLAREFAVGVAAPRDTRETRSEEPPLPFFSLPMPMSALLRGRFTVQPRRGHVFLGREGVEALADIVGTHKPGAIMYSHSYLATMGGQLCDTPVVVDFPNIESERMMSLAASGQIQHRAAAVVEALKARVWEPSVARSASLNVVVDNSSAQRLVRWGADVVVVPNVAEQVQDAGFSPACGSVVFIASYGYAPNAAAAEVILHKIWPRVSRVVPQAKLVLAGHESDTRFGWANAIPGVTVTGEVPTMGPLLAEAAVVLAPVTNGGGTQLKVAQGLAARRVVVATPYSARSIPREFLDGCVVRNDWRQFADAVAELLTDVDSRHHRETMLRRIHLGNWSDVAAPLLVRMRALLASREASPNGRTRWGQPG